MFTDTNDKTIVIHPDASTTIRDYLGDIEMQLRNQTPGGTEAALSRVRAIDNVLSPGFGKAARVTPDGPGSLFVAEYPDADAEQATYVFGCIQHSDGTVGVHS